MKERRTARVLLLDPENRILLLKGRLPSAPDAPGWWFTVGGGVEADEEPRAAAMREIVEETGFADVFLGAALFDTDQVLDDRKGRAVRHHATFFIARCAGGEPSRAGWQPLEREFVDDIRWWTLEDLAATNEPFYPPDLVARVRSAISMHG